MAVPKKDTIRISRRKGRFRVAISDDVHRGLLPGVTNVEIVRPIKERIVDGWRTAEPDGDPVVRIEVPLRFVTLEPNNG